MPGYGPDGPCGGEAVRYRAFGHHGLGWPDNRRSTLLGYGIQRDRRQNRGFGRRDDNSGMGVCWPVSGSTCAPGVVDVAIIPPDKSAGTNTLRHSHARHLLVHGIPINHLPTWLQLCDTESGS